MEKLIGKAGCHDSGSTPKEVFISTLSWTQTKLIFSKDRIKIILEIFTNSTHFNSCYVAQDMSSGQLIGYVLFFNTLDERSGQLGGSPDDPVAVIEDLYVKPRFRGRGVGSQLFRRVLKVRDEEA